MSKTHTTTQILTASKFNSHDSTGNCVLEIGPVLFNGTIVTIGGYKVRYNGIIFETTDIVTHDTAGYNYLCVAGIDASPTSTPYTLVTNVRQGVCLIEKYKDGWITKDNKFKGDLRGLAFTRSVDATGSYYHACYGPGVTNDGTLVHTPIKLQFYFDSATGSQVYPGVSDMFFNNNTTALGTVSAYGCNGPLAIYTETMGPTVVIQNNKLITTDTVAAVAGSCLAVMETSDTHCVFAYSVLDHLFVGTNEYGVGPGAIVDYTLTDDVTHVDFVTPTTVLVELADHTFIYGMLMPATIDTIFSGSSRWFHVDHKSGNFVHVGTDDKLYKNTTEIGSTLNFAFAFDEKIFQVDSLGYIYDGGKITQTGFRALHIVANRTPTDELFMMFINAGGVDAVSYNPVRCETTFSSNLSGAATICAITFANNITTAYLDSDEITYAQPISVGSLHRDSVYEIIPSEKNQWRYGKKHFQLDTDYLGQDIYIDSNTDGMISYRAGTVHLGTYGNHTVLDISMSPLVVGPMISDGDCLESLHAPSVTYHYTKCIACDYDTNTKSALLTKSIVGSISIGPCRSISSGITLTGGLTAQMDVYAADSVVYNAEIQTLNIYVAKNVMFVGCTIGVYTDFAVLPQTNEYQFIGCTIGGVPANTFLALTDTPGAYVSPGDMLVTNGTATGLEFATVAKQASATEFNYLRQDMVNNVATGTWAEPASITIHQSVKDPTGFEDISSCTINYSPTGGSARIVSLTFSGDTYIWHHGKRHKFENGESFVWADHTDNTGIYFFYLQDDGAGGLEAAQCSAPTFWDLSAVVPVTYVIYKDVADGGGTADGFANEERHDNTWPWSLHRDTHLNRGAWSLEDGFAASGYTIGGEAIANKKVALAEGTVIDEDIWNSVAAFASGTYAHFYLNAAGDWTWNKGETFPVPYTGSAVPGTVQNPKYNEVGVGLTEVTLNNRWFNTYIFATNSLDPTFRFVVIIGQNLYTSLALAQGAGLGSLTLGTTGAFPFQECVALYQITWRRGPYDLGLAYNPYARIDAVTRIIGERITVTGLASTNHAALTGRDLTNSHPASAVGYDNQTETQTIQDDVQAALDELYNINVDEASFTDPATFDTVDIASAYTDTSAANDIISVTADVIGTVTVLGAGSVGVALKDAFHRRFDYQAVITAGVLTLLGSEDETIFYEAASFENARLDPATYLGGAGIDYVSVHTDGSIRVRGIDWGGASSTVRYAVRFDYNRVSHVP